MEYGHRCISCEKVKRPANFRYIHKFRKHVRTCKVCEAQARAKKKREHNRHINEHGVSPGIKNRLEISARVRARAHARKEILGSLIPKEIEQFEFAEKLNRISGLAAFAIIIALFLLLYRQFELSFWTGGFSVAFLLFNANYRKRHLTPLQTQIEEKVRRLSPALYELLRTERLAYEKFYGTSEWRTVRNRFLAKEMRKHGKYICQYCNSEVKWDVTVDHVKPRSKFPELALEISNLAVAHRACNSAKGAKILTGSH